MIVSAASLTWAQLSSDSIDGRGAQAVGVEQRMIQDVMTLRVSNISRNDGIYRS